MKKLLFASVLLFGFSSQASYLSEAVCEVTRTNMETLEKSSQTSIETLTYESQLGDISVAEVNLENSLFPSFKINYKNTSRGNGNELDVKVIRKSDGSVVSSFNAKKLVNDPTLNESLPESKKYFAKSKNIFGTTNEKYHFDVVCYENAYYTE